MSEIVSSLYTTTSAWTVASVRATLDEHEEGRFAASAQLAMAMLRDSDVFAALSTREAALSSRTGLPFSVEPSMGVDDRRAVAIAKLVHLFWWLIVPEATLGAMERDRIQLGFSVGRSMRRRIDGDWYPKLVRLRPNGAYWSTSDDRPHYVDAYGVDHVVTPGENGWIWHAPDGPDSWQLGAVRPIGLPWVMATHTPRDWARYNEKHGLVPLKVYEPQSASDDVEGSQGDTGAKRFYRDIKRMPSEGVVRCVLPQSKDENGWDVEWMELSNGESWRSFERQLIELRRRINSVYLGVETGTPKGGDEVGFLQRVKFEYLTKSAEGWSTTLREQLLKPWVEQDLSAKPELAPWPRWSTAGPADLASRASTIDKAADAISKLDALNVEAGPFIAEMGLPKRDQKPGPSQKQAEQAD